ncbi:NAD-dependent epimerase/dehydratase family protein [Spirulina subsalsa FACHB-351]|uniref:NAD-dependent epimerase/dehydratase family protein n=1 Tax=Spirulina subsalsa FACHB-351 TaxID=234711 RepID=A0ABT3L610_9CYAN|nr:NAD-dependent epimerase/dehydratase family protein [Spirulina subsalsa]MCW6036938.1 NAD-dependent epimerase/dehydratase family protein [Spirulina subsalsa FACHB-351]
MNFPTRLILVTGADGWLGINLIKALTQGLPDCKSLAQPDPNLKIRCLLLPGHDPKPLTQLSPNVEIIYGNLCNPHDCEKFCHDATGAILFHTAGIIHPQRVRQFYAINVQGSQNLLNAAIATRIKRAVVVSSNSPCGCNPHINHYFDESSLYNPYMNYGRSKMQMELLVKAVQESTPLETVIIRPPWFYGPHQPPRQNLFFKMIRDGKGPLVGSGKNLRSMAYVDNICQGLILAATSKKANGQTYWIADEHPYSMEEIINTVEQLLATEFSQKCQYKRLKLPNYVSEIALLLDQIIQSLGLYHPKIHVLSEMNKNIACSVDKARRELGYSPNIDLEEGMRRSLAWIFNNQGTL